MMDKEEWEARWSKDYVREFGQLCRLLKVDCITMNAYIRYFSQSRIRMRLGARYCAVGMTCMDALKAEAEWRDPQDDTIREG